MKTLPAALALAEKESNEAVTIFMRNGCYEISETVVIGNNGHANNLTIKPYGNETVSISGGKHLKKDVLKRVSDQAIAARIRPEMRGKVKEIDLTKLGIPVGGLRASGFGRPSSAGWSELFVNETPMRLSRWPNDSTVLIGEVLEAGTGEHTKEAKLPVFKYAESRPSEWVIDENVWISGYFAHGYADDMIRVARIDTQQKTIHPAQQTVYGFMTGAPWRQWFAVNLVEEIDLPGEYVVDATHGKMYVYLPEEKLASLHVSVLDKP
ncbi:MAG: right-handed parallel beta-helix repeat-containing protein, partial [Tannerellaceae bacterium]